MHEDAFQKSRFHSLTTSSIPRPRVEKGFFEHFLVKTPQHEIVLRKCMCCMHAFRRQLSAECTQIKHMAVPGISKYPIY